MCTNTSASYEDLAFRKGRKAILGILMIIVFISSAGCRALLKAKFNNTVTHLHGAEVRLKDLKEAVTIRRNSMGFPFVEAKSMDDLFFAMGYVHAADRLTQMIGFKLISQGRLSEMIGKRGLELDLYMRAMNLTKFAELQYEASSEAAKRLHERYAQGVNAYLEIHTDRLPPEFQLSNYKPELWEPIDSFSIFGLITLGLASNGIEESSILNIAQAVGAENLPWLLPIYPDEPLPFEEAEKLAGIDLAPAKEALASMQRIQERLSSLTHIETVASNNWAISKNRTKNKTSIFANDTHLPLMIPSMWNIMHLRCPEYDAAGVTVAGILGVVAGFNGRLGWGMTMVMGDNQDLFLEQLEIKDGKLCYLHKGRWIPASERKEIFKIKDEETVEKTIHETIHGPLISEILSEASSNDLLPNSSRLHYGIAASWAAFEPDQSWDAFLEIGRADSVESATPWVKKIRGIALNFVYADKDNIAWQVTGRYPIRKKGRGLVPSPGWTGDYDWNGYLQVEDHPSLLNPPEGFIGTANNKSIGNDFPYILSSSWIFPERSERIAQLLGSRNDHTMEDSKRMHYEAYSLFVGKLQSVLFAGEFRSDLNEAIESWRNENQKKKAREAIDFIRTLKGELPASSAGAAVLGAFYHTYLHNTFQDELGGEQSMSWKAFIDNLRISYSALPDHLLFRGDESPFWDNTNTPQKETKAEILAMSFADAIDYLEERLGKNRQKWQWGRLHTYFWHNEAAKDPTLKGFKKRVVSQFFDRGPVDAGGDHTTLNVTVYSPGRSFDTWFAPAMRIIVDFSKEEPFIALNSSGQSGNPASDHYDDGISAWLEGRYQTMPFLKENIEQQYTSVMILLSQESID